MPAYSTTPLIKKLGIKEGYNVSIIDAPAGYWDEVGELPPDAQIVPLEPSKLNFVHIFVSQFSKLEEHFLACKESLDRSGMLWVSWPKQASKMPTDLNRDIIREYGLSCGLVDVKVASFNDVYSGLKFVYRVKDR